MLLQAAEALLVAANAAVNFLAIPGGDLVGPCRVSQQLAAHRGAGNAPRSKLFLYKIRVGQTAHTGDGLVGELAHLIAEFQEAALPLKIRVVGRGDGVLQAGVVCQRNVEAGNTGIHQHRHKDAQFLLQYTGVAVVRVFLPDGKLIVNGQLRQAAADCLDCLHGKAGAIFGAAAVLVGALVEHGGAEAAAHTVAMHLHHIKPGLDRQHGSLAEAIGDFLNFLYR